jgi:cbb3-type cytochrome oxidase subunit 3
VSVRDFLEFATFIVTIVALPFAVWVFLAEQRKERENEEEEAYLHLADAYNDFLKIVLANADLQLRSNAALANPTPEQNERMLTIFDMLISLFERAFLIAFKPAMSPTEQRRWNSWDDSMREWCRRDDFHNCLPLLLRGEDPEFTAYIKRVAHEERGAASTVLTPAF